MADDTRGFPTAAGIWLGLGLGGFFDGIVLHQILQWHHMLTSAGFPPDSTHNLKVNTFWDGMFHASTYVFVAIGLGLGGFVDGIVLHQILQWHHMLSSEGSYPKTTVAGLEANTLADGLFHASTWILAAIGVWLLWRAAPHTSAIPATVRSQVAAWNRPSATVFSWRLPSVVAG